MTLLLRLIGKIPIRKNPSGSHREVAALVFVACAALLSALAQTAQAGQSAPVFPQPPVAAEKSASPTPLNPALLHYDRLPLRFEPNRGQTDPQVKFLSRGDGYTLFLTPAEAVLVLRRAAPPSAFPRAPLARPLWGAEPEEAEATPVVIRLALVGSHARPRLKGLDELPSRSHYFRGNDPQGWHADVPNYRRVEYQEVYPGVNLAYYGNQRQLEFDFIVAPGADPQAIRLSFRGASRLDLDAKGNLILRLPTGRGKLTLHAPAAYQEVNGVQEAVPARYVLQGNQEVSFDIAAYDASKPLVIDPVLSYSTYLGGSGVDWANAITVDDAGNVYLTGATASTDFPTESPLQGGNAGSYDAFVMKLNANGSALVYSSYFGGSLDDQGVGIAVDAAGHAYVTGFTESTDFPTQSPFQAIQGGGTDAFVVKFNAAGSALVYSTFLGGNEEDYGSDIAVDAAQNAYVTGSTTSIDFPLANPFQAVYGGSSDFLGDVFVTKLDPTGTTLEYSTYLGGSGDDASSRLAVDAAGNAYVTGFTSSTDFPTASPFQAAYGGGYDDAFLTKLDAQGSALVYSTYLGGNDADEAFDIAIDAAGNAYVAGATVSSDFPTTNPLQGNFGGGASDAFVVKFTPDGSALSYASYLGGNDADVAFGIALDSGKNAYLAGYTSSPNFPTANPLQAVYAGGQRDAFVAVVTAPGSTLAFGTYLGGNDWDEALSLAVDASGQVYVTGFTASTDFPTVNSVQPGYGGNYDVFVSMIGDVLDGVPVANAGPDQVVAARSDSGTQVTLDGSASFDPEGDPLTFTWSGPFPEGGGTVTGVNPTVTLGIGTSTITLVVSDGQVDSAPDTVEITITDFTVTASPTSATVAAGQSATYSVSVSPQFGPFGENVSLACRDLPAMTSCTFSPASLIPGPSSATASLTVSTTGAMVSRVRPISPTGPQRPGPFYAIWLSLPGLAVVGVAFVGTLPAKEKLRFRLALALLLVVVIFSVACGGSGLVPSAPSSPLTSPATPAGTYTITISATAGALERAYTVELIVN